MSSSDKSGAGRRFLITVLVSSLMMLSGMVAATALVDPYGMLAGPSALPTICAPGIKSRDGIEMVLALPNAHPPAEIISGSSRVIWGFASLDRQDQSTTVLNLGLSSATMPDIDRIVRNAAQSPSLERVWIGLDFGAVGVLESQYPAESRASRRSSPRWMAIREGLLSPRAWQATVAMLRHPQTCTEPPFDQLGFLRPGTAPVHAGPRAVLLSPRESAVILDAWHQPTASLDVRYAREMARLTRLLLDLNSQGVAVVVYTGPTHPAYDRLIEEAGLSGFRSRWRVDVERIAREQGAVLVAADRADFLTSLPDLPVGCETAPVDCVFYDATHFRPIVGEAIIGEGRRLAAERVVPSMH